MRVGDIFRSTFSSSNSKLTLADINKHTPKKLSYKSYGLGIVSKRGNIFKNQNLDINQMVDNSLKNPLLSAR